MSGNVADTTQQAGDVPPPRAGRILPLTVDSTSRAYSLHAINLAQYNTATATTDKGHIWFAAQAETNDVFIAFAETSVTVVDTAAVLAGSGLSFPTGACIRIPAGLSPEANPWRLRRDKDKFMMVKTASGAAILRIFFGNAEPGTVDGYVEA